MNSPERRMDLLMACETRVFFCHQTMLNLRPERGVFLGDYDQNRKADGSPATIKDHQICAGFAALYTPNVTVDYSTIDIEGHWHENLIREGRDMDVEG